MEVLLRLGPARHGVRVSVTFGGRFASYIGLSGIEKYFWCIGGRRDIEDEALGMVLRQNSTIR